MELTLFNSPSKHTHTNTSFCSIKLKQEILVKLCEKFYIFQLWFCSCDCVLKLKKLPGPLTQRKCCESKKKTIDLTLCVLAVLVGRHVVDGVALWAVRGGAVRLRAGQRGQSRHGGYAGETLQTLDVVHALAAAGRHAGGGFQATRQRGDGVVALGLMRNPAGV